MHRKHRVSKCAHTSARIHHVFNSDLFEIQYTRNYHESSVYLKTMSCPLFSFKLRIHQNYSKLTRTSHFYLNVLNLFLNSLKDHNRQMATSEFQISAINPYNWYVDTYISVYNTVASFDFYSLLISIIYISTHPRIFQCKSLRRKEITCASYATNV
jgi:hypothetical protein